MATISLLTTGRHPRQGFVDSNHCTPRRLCGTVSCEHGSELREGIRHPAVAAVIAALITIVVTYSNTSKEFYPRVSVTKLNEWIVLVPGQVKLGLTIRTNRKTNHKYDQMENHVCKQEPRCDKDLHFSNSRNSSGNGACGTEPNSSEPSNNRKEMDGRREMYYYNNDKLPEELRRPGSQELRRIPSKESVENLRLETESLLSDPLELTESRREDDTESRLEEDTESRLREPTEDAKESRRRVEPNAAIGLVSFFKEPSFLSDPTDNPKESLRSIDGNAEGWAVSPKETGRREGVESRHRIPPGRKGRVLPETDGLFPPPVEIECWHALTTWTHAALEYAVASRRWRQGAASERRETAMDVALLVDRVGDHGHAPLRRHPTVSEQRLQPVHCCCAHGLLTGKWRASHTAARRSRVGATWPGSPRYTDNSVSHTHYYTAVIR
ncbi:hypothetical protein J6590_037337, partial [Homalodisca vitripennis]